MSARPSGKDLLADTMRGVDIQQYLAVSGNRPNNSVWLRIRQSSRKAKIKVKVKVKVKRSHYRPGQALRVPES